MKRLLVCRPRRPVRGRAARLLPTSVLTPRRRAMSPCMSRCVKARTTGRVSISASTPATAGATTTPLRSARPAAAAGAINRAVGSAAASWLQRAVQLVWCSASRPTSRPPTSATRTSVAGGAFTPGDYRHRLVLDHARPPRLRRRPGTAVRHGRLGFCRRQLQRDLDHRRQHCVAMSRTTSNRATRSAAVSSGPSHRTGR